MLTKKQIKSIIHFYIEPLFNVSLEALESSDFDPETYGERLIFKQGFYYASRLNEFLQGNWRNVEIDYLTDEQKERKEKETGRVCQFKEDFFVKYDNNYYDCCGEKEHDNNSVILSSYKVGSEESKKEAPLSEIVYCDKNPVEFNNYYRNAIWAIFDAMFTPFKNELITKLDKSSKDGNDVGFDVILNIYRTKSIDLLENDPGVKMKVEDIIKEAKEQHRKLMKEKRFNINLPTEIDINGVKKTVSRWNELTPEEMKIYKNSIEFQERIDEAFPMPSSFGQK